MGTLLEIALSNAVVAGVLALVAAGLAALFRRPALTHRLWLLVLLKLVTPPLIPVHLPRPAAPDLLAHLVDRPAAPADTRLDAAPVPETPERPGPEVAAPAAEPDAAGPEDAAPTPGASAPPVAESAWISAPWPAYLVPLWPLLSLVWLAWNGLHMLRFRRLLRHTVPAADLQEEADALARRLGLRRSPPVRLVPGAVSPMVWGVGPAQRLLFPARLLDRLDREQRASLLLHELAHVRRGDPWVRVLELVVLPLYWWHPVAWWARRELREAEEQCCDAWVVWALAGAGRTYALALLQAVALCANVRSALPLAASGIGQVPHLRRRLTMIMQAKTPRCLSRVGAVAVLGLGLLLLPLLRVAGQPPQPAPDPASHKEATERLVQEIEKAVRALQDQQRAEQQRRAADAEQRRVIELEQPPATEHAVRTLRLRVVAVDTTEALKRAQDEVAVLKKELDAKQRELHEVEQRYAAAVESLARLKDKAKAAEAAVPVPQAGAVLVSPKGDRLGELEQKLERVLEEVKELRQELRRDRVPTPPRRPAPPAPGDAALPPAAPVPPIPVVPAPRSEPPAER
jgi:beta-lactamase regulating signal transducer with metallopeptidase domain